MAISSGLLANAQCKKTGEWWTMEFWISVALILYSSFWPVGGLMGLVP